MSEGEGEGCGMKNELATPSNASAPAPSLRKPRQLDFALPSRPTPPSARRPRPDNARTCRRERAQWWFTQMRQIVAEGRDFNAAGVF